MKGKLSKRILTLSVTGIVLGASLLTGCGNNTEGGESGSIEITNVSYDPTREFYAAYNEEFKKYWKEEKGDDVEIVASHGGSGSQARSVIEGNEADVVTLALARDISAIENEGLIESGWIDEFEHNSSPYTSTIVFLVRKGNEKGINDWGDLVKEGVGIITPNPKTSGGACWNFLAAWAFADKAYGGDEAQIKDFMAKLYKNVLVLDSGARGSTSTFVENGQGDVLLAWENEAFLTLKEKPDEYEMITPSISILAEPSVAVVDSIAKERGTQEVASAYLEYLYSDMAQRLIGENFYRPTNETILKEFSSTFNLDMNMVTIDDFGGWEKAYNDYFNDGAIFDQIYTAPAQ
ncbi:MAG: sulfate ABC transporter substrate-binding protein [Lachnoclostridium sp.]|jgi:sulfate transport system substrate-binding protein|nr:sulfate ABC transporter substrate-binding protein [Lachnoclostridium sp.]